MSLILQGCTRLFRTFITALSHTPILTFNRTLLRIGSEAHLTSLRITIENVPHNWVPKMSLWPMAGNCAGHPRGLHVCHFRDVMNYSSLQIFYKDPRLFETGKKNQHGELIYDKHVLQSFATWTVPFSRLLLQYSRPKNYEV